MKHKHYDMIVAKAANMDLVVFCMHHGDDHWEHAGREFPIFCDLHKYFTCLEKHEDAVLEGLNGGDCQFSLGDDVWIDADEFQFSTWSDGWWHMCEKFESRIKPKKEKRWVGVTSKGVVDKHFEDEFELTNYTQNQYVESVARTLTCHEIEVEV